MRLPPGPRSGSQDARLVGIEAIGQHRRPVAGAAAGPWAGWTECGGPMTRSPRRDVRQTARMQIVCAAEAANWRTLQELGGVSDERRPAPASDVTRWKHNLQCEVDGAHIYRAMAANAGDPRWHDLSEMADAEQRHAALWRGAWRPLSARAVSPSWRARTLAFLARRLGAGLVAPTMASDERESRTMYDDQPEASGTTLPADERSHARTLHRITGGLSGAMLSRFEGRHRMLDGNALRAAVLGANDGLVSNLSP